MRPKPTASFQCLWATKSRPANALFRLMRKWPHWISKPMDQTTIETTPTAKPKEKSIRKGESFTFFSNQAKTTLDEITETRQVEGIGILSGVAKALPERPGKWAIVFQNEAPAFQTPQGPPIEGEPGENLVMFATLLNGELRGCYRLITDEQNKRRIDFNNWFSVPPEETNPKSYVISSSENTKGNSLIVDDADVRYSKFKFV